MRFTATSAVVLAALVVCTGCSGAPATTTMDEICSRPIIVECTSEAPLTLVTVSASASDDDTLDLARELYATAATGSGDSQTLLRRESRSAVSLDPEFSTPEPWTLRIQPGERADVESALRSVLAIEDIPGALGIHVEESWPSVTVETLDQFPAVFDAASALPAFEDGGSYRLLALDDHLRIEHTPKWVEPELIQEVIAIAVDYPRAEVLLEAPMGGDTPPTLYIAKLSPEEVDEVGARLSAPALADTVATGFQLQYVLGSIGANGTTYLGGILGQPF